MSNSSKAHRCGLRASLVLIALVLTTLLAACSARTSSSSSSSPDVTENMGGASDLTGTAGSESPPEAQPGWCEVEQVLRSKCQRCHSAPPEHGAPFALVTYTDTQVVNKAGKSRCDAIEAALADDYMPARFVKLEPPVVPLEADEKALLIDWCQAGAPDAPARACP